MGFFNRLRGKGPASPSSGSDQARTEGDARQPQTSRAHAETSAVKKNVAFDASLKDNETYAAVGPPLTQVQSIDSHHGVPLAACYPTRSASQQQPHHTTPSTPFPSTSQATHSNEISQQRKVTNSSMRSTTDHSRAISPMSCASIATSNVHGYPAFGQPSSSSYRNNAHFGTHTPAGQSTPDSDQITAPVTWAQMAGADLVGNLGGRERTRQEVLWEIVASEERYVAELLSMLECYIEPLLYPGRSKAPQSTQSHLHGTLLGPSPMLTTSSTHAPESSDSSEPIIPLMSVGNSTAPPIRAVSVDHLPIAARFARSQTIFDDVEHPVGLGLNVMENDASSATQRPVSASTHCSDGRKLQTLNGQGDIHSRRSPLEGRIHTPPSHLQAEYSENPSSSSRNVSPSFRHHLKARAGPSSKKLHRPKTAIPETELTLPTLPADLRILLECISENLASRHEALSGALRERWRAQYPLVRSLADVWIVQDWIISTYSTYVLHLERGLKSIDRALSTVTTPKGRKHHASDDHTKEDKKLARWIMRLEEVASAKGESGLAICLSKPFQRLLKYPLLFQNLLYHTDASTAEYESTRDLAIEIDRIVKSIENDKISEEERDKIRDLWARIEGVNDRSLMLPRSDRILLEEEPLWKPPHSRRSVSDAARNARSNAVEDPGMLSDSGHRKPQKPSKSNRRLSDMMSAMDRDKKEPSIGSKRDIWLIRLSDVIIRCHRIGITRLPLGAVNSMRDANKYNDKKNSGNSTSRNLYQFLQVERWQVSSNSFLDERSANLASLRQFDAAGTVEADKENEAAVKHGGISRMSFSYSADEPTPIPEPLLPISNLPPRVFKTPDAVSSSKSAASPLISDLTLSATTKRGPAPAKFANRLRTSDAGIGVIGPRSPTPTQASGASYMAPTRASASRIRSPTPVNQHQSGIAPKTVRSPSPLVGPR